MATKKTATSKKKDVSSGSAPLKEEVIEKAKAATVPQTGELCMRYIDKSNVSMSDNPKFKKYDPNASKVVPEGMKRYDASTVLPV